MDPEVITDICYSGISYRLDHAGRVIRILFFIEADHTDIDLIAFLNRTEIVRRFIPKKVRDLSCLLRFASGIKSRANSNNQFVLGFIDVLDTDPIAFSRAGKAIIIKLSGLIMLSIVAWPVLSNSW